MFAISPDQSKVKLSGWMGQGTRTCFNKIKLEMAAADAARLARRVQELETALAEARSENAELRAQLAAQQPPPTAVSAADAAGVSPSKHTPAIPDPLVGDVPLSAAEVGRYARQLIMPEIGVEGGCCSVCLRGCCSDAEPAPVCLSSLPSRPAATAARIGCDRRRRRSGLSLRHLPCSRRRWCVALHCIGLVSPTPHPCSLCNLCS